MSNEQTFDLDNQPGVRKTAISRTTFKQLAEVLGLDPAYVISLEASDSRVLVTAMLQTTDGARALGGGSSGGYLKHTYEIPLEDELCTPGKFDGADEWAAAAGLVDHMSNLAKLRAIAPGQEQLYLRMATMLASVGATEDQIVDCAKRIARGTL